MPKTKKLTWFEYTKIILKKVSFDPQIFQKELRKSLKRLTITEINKLEAWCINKFPLGLALIAIQVIQEYLDTMQL